MCGEKRNMDHSTESPSITYNILNAYRHISQVSLSSIMLLGVLVYSVATLLVFTYIFAWKNMDYFLRRIFIFTNTKQKLKAIREYDDIYLYSAGLIIVLGSISLLGIAIYFDLPSSANELWTSLITIISSLERGNLVYQCSFGLTFQSLKCSIISAVNNSIFYLVTKFLSWMHDAFTLTNFNPFHLASTISFYYYFAARFFGPEMFYIIIRRAVNNFIVLFHAIVSALYAIHNWKDIVMKVPDDAVDVADDDGDAPMRPQPRRPYVANAIMPPANQGRNRRTNDHIE